jgi:adenylate cyclase
MVHAGVRNKFSFGFTDLGEQSLKNIADPLRIFKVVIDATSREGTSATDAMFRRPAMAVLPFENLSGDPEQEYFADGLTEDIITALSLWKSFPVIARNSTFAFKGQSRDIRKIGEELGARYVIEGSIRKSADRIRVTVQLINSETGHHVWADRFDKDLADFFELQEEIAYRIAATVEPELARTERNLTAGKATDNFSAWECYQRGNAYLIELTKESQASALSMFKRAIELDPKFSQAYAGAALSHIRDLYIGSTEENERSARACLEYAQQAIAADEGDALAHTMLGFALTHTGRPELGVGECEKALSINPGDAFGYGVLAFALLTCGRYVDSIAAYERALIFSPKDPWNHIRTGFLAEGHLQLGHPEQAAEYAQRALLLFPSNLHANIVFAASLGHLGRGDDGKAALRECLRIDPQFIKVLDEVWPQYRSENDLETLRDGLRKAGWEG